MAEKIITVTRLTQPVLYDIMTTFRDARDPLGAEDITGWTIKFSVKRSLDDVDGYEFFTITAAIVTAADGVYSLTFSSAETNMPAGRYPGELRWWKSGAVPATDMPFDRQSVDYVVQEAVDQVI